MGLMTTAPRSPARASIADAQSNHSVSSLRKSNSTLESTSVATTLLAARELHQLVGCHAWLRFRRAAHELEESLPTSFPTAHLADPGAVAINLEHDFTVRK